MRLSVIVPTANEAPNIEQLVNRVAGACKDLDAEIIFVDDSSDNTPEVICRAATAASLPVRLIHRAEPNGTLSGAVVGGLQSSSADYCLVMAGDLQHPPEMIPVLLAELEGSGNDVALASRYCGPGSSAYGLANLYRRIVSGSASLLTRCLFPSKLGDCSDPLTGFFALRRSTVDYDRLRPGGFKILLEILGRHRLAISEVPFIFEKRAAGTSKAGVRAGMGFLHQLLHLRVGRAGLFAGVGAVGAVLNLLIMGLLLAAGSHYVLAAIVAAELTIVSNFLMQERLVFGATLHTANSRTTRFLYSFGFNNAEALLRLPILMFAVETHMINSVIAQGITLLAAFTLRYLYHSKVVYRSRQATPAAATALGSRREPLVPRAQGDPVV
ncbi:glycosyl transferase family 2 [Arthrobacter sp. SPG23]|uniref:glycosyltransferase n=1 Tax=Arthrobacter sp. SPG23 TaxID=1610703 RepID=UPI0005BA6382|nr:glycosyltransferase [Arthrobacter sp. SPG23]KIS27192.1 glycosyl transferase family 2 [Arthrobacter sp. SPG23]